MQSQCPPGPQLRPLAVFTGVPATERRASKSEMPFLAVNDGSLAREFACSLDHTAVGPVQSLPWREKALTLAWSMMI